MGTNLQFGAANLIKTKNKVGEHCHRQYGIKFTSRTLDFR